MEIIKFALIGILCAVLVVVVRQQRPELAIIVQLAGIVVLVILSIEYMKNIFAETDGLFSDAEFLNDGYLELLVKNSRNCRRDKNRFGYMQGQCKFGTGDRS